ncbi:hypothetical protein NM208_g8331 [Fusarium decemcellulare]|uniref:Uncharacterized protein n=1 Tax=Fusarium decemcellulare TaxID=57161 RepID=A0ACC1S5R7_9HYPO|nr:hypothetical protein NM208_g8331 [Fusarium decemcellulare]
MVFNLADGLQFGAGNTKVDPAVLKELPEGCSVTSTESHGVSFWAQTGRIDVLLRNDTPQSFFIKVMSKEIGMKMAQAEFQSMNAIHNVVPEFVPKPIASGTYETIPDIYFFLCEFREMTDDMPDPHKFATLLSKLHQKSVSPTGKFGFHVTTYAGNLPQFTAWEDSWETFFAKSMRQALDLEIERKGPSEELDVLSSALFETVIPRLLRPLESDGRTVKPSLVHGDLWYANAGIDIDSEQPLVFDACCFFAHNEYEFGQWRPACNRFGDQYIASYNTLTEISEPREDFEGRLDLYRLRFDTHVSALFVEKETLCTQWNPDPHVIRVDDTYYVAVSSFLTFPGIPIYKSQDLANWELISHAIDQPHKVPITGVRTGNGVWAPSISYINGRFYVTSMAMTGSDPDYRTWPRMFWVSSEDLKTWSDVVWGEPYGIDPHLFQDPISKKSYLTIMGLNNGYDRLWGISQCEVDLDSGACVGPYQSIWNGTMPVTNSTRPEGPKLFYKDKYYYLLIAEGGTGVTHRASIARSKSPEGPWESSPTNPLIFNGADTGLTVGNTGHATFADTPDGEWFATFLARRYVSDWSVLGRETFFAPVTWKDGWPTMNNGEYVLLSQEYDHGPDVKYPPKPYEDLFEGSELRSSWYQIRSPYSKTYRLDGKGKGLVLLPNVYTLSDRDTPSVILRKQLSVNMTFTATLLPIEKGLGPYQSVGVSAYSSEMAHQDVGVRGCAKSSGLCIFVDITAKSPGPGTPPQTEEFPLKLNQVGSDLKLHIRAEPRQYRLGYSLKNGETTWVKTFSPSLLPVGFDGVMFGLFASGNSFPWPYDAPEVGFSKIREEYFDEGFGDYKNQTQEG